MVFLSAMGIRAVKAEEGMSMAAKGRNPAANALTINLALKDGKFYFGRSLHAHRRRDASRR